MRRKRFFSFRNVQMGSEAHPASYSVCTGVLPQGCSRRVKLTTHIHLVPRLGMSGAIPPTRSANLYSTAPLVPQLVEDVPALYGSPHCITLLCSEPIASHYYVLSQDVHVSSTFPHCSCHTHRSITLPSTLTSGAGLFW